MSVCVASTCMRILEDLRYPAVCSGGVLSLAGSYNLVSVILIEGFSSGILTLMFSYVTHMYSRLCSF